MKKRPPSGGRKTSLPSGGDVFDFLGRVGRLGGLLLLFQFGEGSGLLLLLDLYGGGFGFLGLRRGVVGFAVVPSPLGSDALSGGFFGLLRLLLLLQLGEGGGRCRLGLGADGGVPHVALVLQ